MRRGTYQPQFGTAVQLSPIARMQRSLYGNRLGLFGAGPVEPPVGAGTGAGAEIGASQGATIGSAIVPGIGTAIGAVVGAIGGAIAGSINKRDPEEANFAQAVAMWQGNRLSVLNLGNKYLPVAGLFDLDLNGPHIPIYIKYNRKAGRGGEEKFVGDLATLIYQAAQAGHITARDTPQTVMQNIVQPWIDSWGYGPMQDPHADLINLLILGLVMDYVTGYGPQAWRARGGDLPVTFAHLPTFALAQQAPVAPSNAAYVASGAAVASSPVSATTQPLASALQPPPPPAPAPVTAPAPAPVPVAVPPPLPVPAPTPGPPTTVPIPQGFAVIGTAKGMPAYQGPDGNYYSWTGTAMLPVSGTLYTLTGQSIPVNAGTIAVPPAASLLPSAYSAPSYSPPPAPVDYSSSFPAAVPPTASAPSAVTQAGLTGGPALWLMMAAFGGLLLLGRPKPNEAKSA